MLQDLWCEHPLCPISTVSELQAEATVKRRRIRRISVVWDAIFPLQHWGTGTPKWFEKCTGANTQSEIPEIRAGELPFISVFFLRDVAFLAPRAFWATNNSRNTPVSRRGYSLGWTIVSSWNRENTRGGVDRD